MTLRSPAAFIVSTFTRRCSSTNGPFFRLRGMCCYLRLPRPRRRRTISWSDVLPFLRVRPSGLPHGDTGWRPPELLPSPPPSGWSTGFMATPRTCGRLPFQRLRPALPIEISAASALPTEPTVARQSIGDAAHLGGGEAQRGVQAFLGDELDRGAGAAAQLRRRRPA